MWNYKETITTLVCHNETVLFVFKVALTPALFSPDEPNLGASEPTSVFCLG